jgi:tetratricopeptide (TPR) repeat protein
MENLNASNIEVNLGLCTTYRFKRDFNNTMKYCNLVLEKRNSDIANDQILQAYIDADMLDDAINHINQILDTEPDNLKSLILKSNILSLQKKYSESIKILQSAIEKYPEAIPSYYYLGKNFYNLKNYKLAIKNLDIFIESVNHKDIDINLLENAYTTLAVSYEKNNEIEKANKIYLKISCFLFKTNRVREGIELAKKITDKKIDLEKCKI